MHKYKYLRRQVHYLHHINSEPIPLDYQHVHPIETIVIGSSYFWIIGGFYLIGYPLNGVALYLAFVFRIMHEIQVHGTNNLDNSAILPGLNSPREHIKHHLKRFGNYASLLPFWDWLLGTQIDECNSGQSFK